MEQNHWNLGDLYENEEQLRLNEISVKKLACEFLETYKDKLEKLKNEEFLKALKIYEQINEELSCMLTYAYLSFATDANKGAFLAKYEQIYTDINENILFFELEFNTLEQSKQDQFISYCDDYAYYLKCLQEDKNHQLSQKEERILLKTSILGSSAFSRLFDEHLSRMKFVFKGESFNEEEIFSKLYDKDQDERKAVASCISETLKQSEDLLAYIFNMIKKDLKLSCELRSFKSLEAPRHKDNKISQKSVDALINATEKNYYLVHEYYDRKRKILKLNKLYHYDRYVPISEDEDKIDFAHAKAIVLEAFGSFSDEFKNIASKAFDEGWIDIYPKDGKRGGAFSHPAVKKAHPYVLLNFTNKYRDLFTLAHELGHAIHQYLAYDVGYLKSDTPLTTAETASIFAEMLVFDYVKNKLSKDEKKAMLARKLEDIYATLFRQIVFTNFERSVHSHEGELSKEDFASYWMKENEKMFSSSVELKGGYENWWSYIPHFIHSPFYCYAYSYGQLLVLALYGLYKSKKCKNFVQIYSKFLSLGGSKSPKELVGMFDLDIEDEDFWLIGLEEIKKLHKEFERLDDETR